MESLAIEQVFGLGTPCSSTKPFTGHTLGAAGAVEAGICWLALCRAGDGWLPPHLWDGVRDPQLAAINLVGAETGAPGLRRALSNSFAFGGNNIALLLERVA
jgi:3-oxoacyl-[acyl-carrier-protein] synthase-1